MLKTVKKPSILYSEQPNYSRPFCTALLDLWTLQTCYSVISALSENDIQNSQENQISLSAEQIQRIKSLAESLKPQAKPTAEGLVDYFSSHKSIALAFEAKYVPKGDRSKGYVLKAVLGSGVNPTDLSSVGHLLYGRVLDGTLAFNHWKKIVLDGGRFCCRDLATLLTSNLRELSIRGTSLRNTDITSNIYKIVEAIVSFSKSEMKSLVNYFVDFSWKCERIEVGFLLGNVLQLLLLSSHSFEYLGSFDLDPLLSKLNDCLFLMLNFSASIIAPITPFNLGKTEKTSIPRIIALYQTTITQTTSPTEATNNFNPQQSPDHLDAIYNHFGPSLKPTVEIYKVRQYADAWLQSPQTISHLESSLAALKRITHPVLRNGVVVFLFHHVMSMKLRALVDMIDKNRKAPKEQACMHNLGGMGVGAGDAIFRSLRRDAR
ncbi:hypothetical protein BDR26DRAFT_78817 [Obelidium mucronatum]|nr:hypothetical protein BDR26DRAFT_78817 [Obelidium mucronatum]